MYSDDDAEVHTVVLDNGSYTCKTGFAGDDAPKSVFPSVVGIHKNAVTTKGIDQKDCYVGNEAQSRRESLYLKYPMHNGVVTDWDCMEKIWHHAFYNELRVTPSEHPVLLIERPFNPKNNREKSVEVMFESLDAPSMYLANQAALSLYASGRTTAVIVDIGYSVSHIVPIQENTVLTDGIKRLDVGGMNLTMYLAEILAEDGHTFRIPADLETVRDLKERLCHVPLDYEDEMKSGAMVKDYELQDGNIIEVRKQSLKCPELLFQPELFGGKESPGLHSLIYDSIMKCSIDIRRELYSNIVLSGGSSMCPGLPERIEKEVKALAPPSIKVKAIAPPECKYFSWIGGSIMGSLSTFECMLITKEEYYKEGPSIVNRKCL